MPKKTRKMKERAAMRRALQSRPSEENAANTSVTSVEEASARIRPSFAPSGRAITPQTFDYSHIYSDLKRIALFAGFFFAVLITLSFVIK